MSSRQNPHQQGGGQAAHLAQPTKIKNKTPAEIQITAEQILKEAHDTAEPVNVKAKQKVSDAEELEEHRFHKRKQFEDAIRRNQYHISLWIKYAEWEETQKELDRARSVFERVLSIDSRNVALWIRYAEMEMRCKNINLARNLWDRACTQLPRVDQFWYKYAYMEEMLGNIAGARQIFERWLSWHPPPEAWEAYVTFELRYKEKDRARALLRRLVESHPKPRNWMRLARFEEEGADYIASRAVYESAVQHLGSQRITAKILLSFARFETRLGELERARAIYRYSLSNLPKSESAAIYDSYIAFEKQHGDRTAIELVVSEKRRAVYESELAACPLNYDVWLDLVRLEEASGNIAKVRDTYERAVAALPPAEDKSLWRRYIYIWLFYASFEESIAGCPERATEVFKACVDCIPHKTFTFAKVWLEYAKHFIRKGDLTAARKTLGYAIGISPKKKLFCGYIELELQLLEFERVRTLYNKYILFKPENVFAWTRLVEVEQALGDSERCRAIFELAVSQPAIDLPEVLWKSYIDFEVNEMEFDRARKLYRRLLERTTHVKVWIAFTNFELTLAKDTAEDSKILAARKIYEEGYAVLRDRNASEERVLLLEEWKQAEIKYGTDEFVENVQAKFPRVRRRRAQQSAGDFSQASGAGDYYFEYEFPEDMPDPSENRLVQATLEWKKNLVRLSKAHGLDQKSESEENSESEEEYDSDEYTTDEEADESSDKNAESSP